MEILGAAGNVAAGLDLVEHASPEIAIVDIQLPDGSGIDLTRELLARRPDLGVILYTGDADLAQEIAALCPSAQPNSKDAICASGKILSARASALGLDLSCEIVSRCFGKKLASGLSASLGIDWVGELSALDIVPGPLLPL